MRLSPDDEDTVRVGVASAPDLAVTSWAGRSSIGLRRQRNEDAWGEQSGRIFVVADGMGGAAGGSRASDLSVSGFLTADPSHGWLQAMRRLNETVHQTCLSEGIPTAGSTLVGLAIDGPRCITISIGDSRIYRLRDGHLELLTNDHNIRSLRAEEGLDPEGQDERGKPAALTSYLGNPDNDQRIDVGTIAVNDGDRILLCSDGVHGQVGPEQLATLIGAANPSATAVDNAVNAADQAGGRDNATAVIIDLEVNKP